MFADCHIHMVLDGANFREAIARHSPSPREDILRSQLESYRDNGITYLRDGGDNCGAAELVRHFAPEYGIDYASPVFPIYREGNYGSFIGRAFSSITEYRKLVAEVGDRGGDFIKLMLSGIMDFDHYGEITGFALDPREMRELVDIAHSEGFAVMAHVNGCRALQDAVEAGVDSIEHGYFSDAESQACLAQSDTVWVPTFAPICNLFGSEKSPDESLRRIADGQSQAVRNVVALGGTVALGSDAGAYFVHHVQGTFDEYALIKAALGEQTDAVLSHGELVIRERFRKSDRSTAFTE
ncbi:MAG: amidohydrolase family protein [Actinobacteria bacterium]|nr:amidohydrolase family protein [Actinomycetota bacterium]